MLQHVGRTVWRGEDRCPRILLVFCWNAVEFIVAWFQGRSWDRVMGVLMADWPEKGMEIPMVGGMTIWGEWRAEKGGFKPLRVWKVSFL